MRRCEACGADLSHRVRARFCDGTCRVRYGRGQRPSAAVVAFPSSVEREPEPDRLLSLEDVAQQLQRRLLDDGTPPTAVAGLAKEYRATLEEIERAKPPVPDEVDEILERRIQRGS